jgi:sulfate adenylyltransferase subunit 1 (EFTu-like GTPase family)
MAGGLLRICTAGSVDDGKSTLIGPAAARLAGGVRGSGQRRREGLEEPQRRARSTSRCSPTDSEPEREQGITIDVAYRYFATAKRKFILADTPGHEQYTRNMATGRLDRRRRHPADRRPQRRAHAVEAATPSIARLLGIHGFVLAINKMDLVGLRPRGLREDPRRSSASSRRAPSVHAIPMSALEGDNVTTRSPRTPYFDGPPMLEYLENVQVHRNIAGGAFRFPVQMVLRPTHEFRGYAGQIVSGTVKPGDRITAWPSGRSANVSRIVTYDGDLQMAFAPMSVTLTLDDEIDISRGDVLTVEPAFVGQQFEAEVVWMDERPLDPARVYLLKQGTRSVSAEVNHQLVLNQIGRVRSRRRGRWCSIATATIAAPAASS